MAIPTPATVAACLWCDHTETGVGYAPHDLTPETLAELRRLREAATQGPWSNTWAHLYAPQFKSGIHPMAECYGTLSARRNAALIAAAVNALPALLDAAAERDALAAKIERVRALHEAGRWYSDHCDDPECDRECVELWVGNLYHADVYDLVCETCSGGDLSETDDPSPWPCPTIRALDGEADR